MDIKTIAAFFLGIVFTLAIISVKYDYVLTKGEMNYVVENKLYLVKN